MDPCRHPSIHVWMAWWQSSDTTASLFKDSCLLCMYVQVEEEYHGYSQETRSILAGTRAQPNNVPDQA